MALEESSAAVDSHNSTADDGNSSATCLDLDRPSESTSTTSSSLSSKLNAQAPAFVPSSSSSAAQVIPQRGQRLVHVYAPPAAAAFHQITGHVPVQNQFLYAPQLPLKFPPSPYYGGGVGGFVDRAGKEVSVAATTADSDHSAKDRGLTEESTHKIVNQVEFYFSDLNLATTDNLIRHMIKDPEGYVPISVVASFKKIKALISSHAQLAVVLRTSTKLLVSEDGKKVKRQNLLTETDLEELQSRIVVAENLPEDHCHSNLMKIFSAVGSVKMIRTCQPQPSNGGASSASRSTKSDSMLYSNKLHAFVEYDTVEMAEKAVLELNDADNWRNGLKVRLLLRRLANSGQARGKMVGDESEVNFKEQEDFESEVNEKHEEDSSHQFDMQSSDIAEEHASDGKRKGRNRVRGKVQGPGPRQTQGHGRGRPHFQQSSRGGHAGASTSNVNHGSCVASAPSNTNHPGVAGPPPVLSDQSASKQSSVPRMPDGTRGFSMGRGRPVAVRTE